MRQTGETNDSVTSDADRTATLVALVSALVVCMMGGALLVAAPDTLRALGAFFGPTVGPAAPSWIVPALAGGFAVGGVLLGLWVLSEFVLGVQTQPYAWLAPVLVVFSALAIGYMPGEVPLFRVPIPLFGALSALLWLGGGALLRMRAATPRLVGAFACVTPLAFVLIGSAVESGEFATLWSSASMSTQVLLSGAALATLGVVLLAGVMGTTEEMVRSAATRQRLEERVASALARARTSETRLGDSERQAQELAAQLRALEAEHGGVSRQSGAREDTGEIAALMRPGMKSGSKLALALLGLTTASAGAYFGLYQPMELRLRAASALVERVSREHASGLAALRRERDAEHAALTAALDAERGSLREALAAGETARARVSALEAEQAAAATAAENPPKATSTRAAAKRSRAARVRRARAVEQGSLGAPVNDDPIGGLDGT